jgi:drug/metabolite transporter (DMT)-like permease
VWAILLALLGSILFAVAAVAQQRAAAETTPGTLGLLGRLARRPLWLAGTGADSLGYVAQAAALGLGALLVVQPLLATSLLFALPLGAALSGRSLRARDWAWAIILTVGLAVFLVAGNPTQGSDHAPLRTWALAAAALVPVIGACVAFGLAARRGAVRAMALGVATGLLYGATAPLTKTTVTTLDDGVVAVLTSWEPYVLAACLIAGLVTQQAAYQAGALGLSLPAITALEPIAAVVLGVALFHERLHADGAEWALIVASAVAMLGALVALPRAAARLEPEPAG